MNVIANSVIVRILLEFEFQIYDEFNVPKTLYNAMISEYSRSAMAETLDFWEDMLRFPVFLAVAGKMLTLL